MTKTSKHLKLFYFYLFTLDNLLQVWPQYVWETIQSLRDQFSGYRAGMKNPLADNKCKIFSKHCGVGLCRNANYIAEKLSGSGRDENGIPIPGVTVERQKKKMKWMLTLQTVYPYGLDDRLGDEYMAEKDIEAWTL